MSDRDHQWKFFEHLWKVEANKAEREFAFKSGWDACAKEYEKENDQTKGSCFHCEEVALMNIKLEEENARLREQILKLKALILYTDEALSSEQCGSDIQLKQWNEFIRCFPE